MWSRRHFNDAQPASLDFLKDMFASPKPPRKAHVRVVDNLAAVALPLRRLAGAKPLKTAH